MHKNNPLVFNFVLTLIVSILTIPLLLQLSSVLLQTLENRQREIFAGEQRAILHALVKQVISDDQLDTAREEKLEELHRTLNAFSVNSSSDLNLWIMDLSGNRLYDSKITSDSSCISSLIQTGKGCLAKDILLKLKDQSSIVFDSREYSSLMKTTIEKRILAYRDDKLGLIIGVTLPMNLEAPYWIFIQHDTLTMLATFFIIIITIVLLLTRFILVRRLSREQMEISKREQALHSLLSSLKEEMEKIESVEQVADSTFDNDAMSGIVHRVLHQVKISKSSALVISELEQVQKQCIELTPLQKTLQLSIRDLKNLTHNLSLTDSLKNELFVAQLRGQIEATIKLTLESSVSIQTHLDSLKQIVQRIYSSEQENILSLADKEKLTGLSEHLNEMVCFIHSVHKTKWLLCLADCLDKVKKLRG